MSHSILLLCISSNRMPSQTSTLYEWGIHTFVKMRQTFDLNVKECGICPIYTSEFFSLLDMLNLDKDAESCMRRNIHFDRWNKPWEERQWYWITYKKKDKKRRKAQHLYMRARTHTHTVFASLSKRKMNEGEERNFRRKIELLLIYTHYHKMKHYKLIYKKLLVVQVTD
jgi:hypothetical protein